MFSTEPLAGIINITNLGFGQAAGHYIATSAAYAADEIYFPLVKYDHGSPKRTTILLIQNASDTNNTMTATFYMGSSSFPITFSNVAPYARIILHPSDAVPSTAATLGSVVIEGNTGQDLAGIALEYPAVEVAPDSLQAYKAFGSSDRGQVLHCPLLRYLQGNYGATTGLQVQNVGTQSTNITVTYTIVDGTPPSVTVYTETNVASGAYANFLQEAHFNANTLASAVITNSAGQELAAVVNDRTDSVTPKRYLQYTCFNETNATTKISLPLVKENYFGKRSGIQVHNIGDAATHVQLTYITQFGQTVVIKTTVPIAAGYSKTFYNLIGGGTNNITVISGDLSYLQGEGKGTVSGVIVESLPLNKDTDPQPIVAVAIESSIPSSNNPQDSKGYEGINLQP